MKILLLQIHQRLSKKKGNGLNEEEFHSPKKEK